MATKKKDYNMKLEDLIAIGQKSGASDVHVESGTTLRIRVNGKLRQTSNNVDSDELTSIVKSLLGRKRWNDFLDSGSFDLSKVIQKSRCRINGFKTSRGLGLAIRLLVSKPVSIASLNLNPDLRTILKMKHGLVLFSGPTGSGKSTTMAALIEELNATQARHIISIEQPVEYFFRSNQSLVRQREVGKDTPSFAHALRDSLREDPDVIVVGEMRDQETMRLTLNAAATGHLTFATVHSSSVSEALSRLISAFPPEEQAFIRSQLADSLAAVVCQRLIYRNKIDLRVPECEILFGTSVAKPVIRSGPLSKLDDVVATNAKDHMWSFQRYRQWLNEKTDWVRFEPNHDYEPEAIEPVNLQKPAFISTGSSRVGEFPFAGQLPQQTLVDSRTSGNISSTVDIVLDEEEDLGSILKELQ